MRLFCKRIENRFWLLVITPWIVWEALRDRNTADLWHDWYCAWRFA